jgi:hypothetical protein
MGFAAYICRRYAGILQSERMRITHTRPIRYDFQPYKYRAMPDPKAWNIILRLRMDQ